MEKENYLDNQKTIEKKGFVSRVLKHKVLAILAIVMLLMIPRSMIQDLILEREQTAREATKEVYGKWGGEQVVAGPSLLASYMVTDTIAEGGKKKIVKEEKAYRILPNKLSFDCDIKTEHRHRGIYDIMTFKGPLKVNGAFVISDEDKENVRKSIENGSIGISFAISDLKGICNEVNIEVSGKKYTLEPNGKGICDKTSQLSANIDISELIDSKEIPFSMEVILKGSQSVMFAPLGKTTTVHMKSDCPTPSFCGNFLPTDVASDSGVTEGFERNWSVSYLNRNYPQAYEERNVNYEKSIASSAFGVNLLVPVGHYQKSMRCVKYAILFIILTMAVFFLIEMIKKRNIHPIQYTLVGLALTLFYSLLISLSEHVGFTIAYGISTFMIVTLLTLYTSAVLKTKKTGIYIGGTLLILYIYIFVLIQMESYALLAGCIGLFIILAIFMYYSQKIDWNGDNSNNQ